jgi:hypothetical protein
MKTRKKTRKLVVLPGGGDPQHVSYKDVYAVILDFAKNMGYEEWIIQGWRGHTSCPGKGVINFDEATESALSLFAEIERMSVGYDVICRSFGTGVFLDVCQKKRLKGIGFATLWGMPSYTKFYELYKEGISLQSVKSKDKGLSIDATFFDTLVPYELLLERFDQDFTLKFLSGELDVVCPPEFNNFLKKHIKNANIRFKNILGLPHELPFPHEEYLQKLFAITG